MASEFHHSGPIEVLRSIIIATVRNRRIICADHHRLSETYDRQEMRRTCNFRGLTEMGLLKTLIGATVGGIVGGPLGMIAGAAIVNDPTVSDGVTQHDE